MKKPLKFDEFEKNLRLCIREERLKSGVTQAELARRSNVLKPSTVTKFESGQTPNITLKSVYEMALASSLPLSELVRRAENEEEPYHEVPWQKLIKAADKLPDEKKNWLARLLQEALRGCS